MCLVFYTFPSFTFTKRYYNKDSIFLNVQMNGLKKQCLNYSIKYKIVRNHTLKKPIPDPNPFTSRNPPPRSLPTTKKRKKALSPGNYFINV